MSKWLEWKKELWRGKDTVLDWIIEDAGDGPRFYCIHDECESITEHYDRMALDREMRKLWQQMPSSK